MTRNLERQAANTWAIIPVRPTIAGKSRLATVLSEDQRRDLNDFFFRHTLEVVSAVFAPAYCLVISQSPALLHHAAALGFGILQEEGDNGLNKALQQAAGVAKAQGAASILSISCDLPYLKAADLEAMLALSDGNNVVIAPDAQGQGTNALLMSPVGAIPYNYGPGSFALHASATEKAGKNLAIVNRPGLAKDIDTPEDLQAFRAVTGKA
jgi:2-phospho-L-lactate guanylyltransferase